MAVSYISTPPEAISFADLAPLFSDRVKYLCQFSETRYWKQQFLLCWQMEASSLLISKADEVVKFNVISFSSWLREGIFFNLRVFKVN